MSQVCNDLKTQTQTDGYPWGNLCSYDKSGNLLRVISPNQYVAVNRNEFSDYWAGYVSQVYDMYRNTSLTVNSGGVFGDQVGQVNSAGTLVFTNGLSYTPPSARDIFGCSSGPLDNSGSDLNKNIAARLCAAFNRATFRLSGGNVQPNGVSDYSQFYSTSPCNHYSRIVHKYEVDHKGYAFAYDDVHPDNGGDLAGVVQSVQANTALLTFTVGGPA